MPTAPRIALYVVFCLSLASCASGRHGFREADAGVGTGPRADPVALFIAGLDTNLDGVTTSDELSAALPKLWASADPSGAAAISIIELNNWRTHWFGSADGWPGQFHFDTDGDGSITRKEFDTGLKSVFDNFDVRKDGRITRNELLRPGGRGAQSRGARDQSGDDDQSRRPRRQPGDGDDDLQPQG